MKRNLKSFIAGLVVVGFSFGAMACIPNNSGQPANDELMFDESMQDDSMQDQSMQDGAMRDDTINEGTSHQDTVD